MIFTYLIVKKDEEPAFVWESTLSFFMKIPQCRIPEWLGSTSWLVKRKEKDQKEYGFDGIREAIEKRGIEWEEPTRPRWRAA